MSFLNPNVPGFLLSDVSGVLTASQELIVQAISSGQYFNSEVPSGTLNGSNQVFTLSRVPKPTNLLQLYYNGQLQNQGTDFTLSSQTVTFTNIKPVATDVLVAIYISSPV